MKTKFFLLALLIPFLGQATQKLYVTNDDVSGSINIIDTATNTVVNTIATEADAEPIDIAFLPNGEKAYISMKVTSGLVLNVAQNNIIKSLDDLAGFPRIAILPNGTRLYAAQLSNFVLVFDTFLDTLVDMIPMDADDFASAIVITPDGSTVYASSFIADTISVVDTATNTVIDTVLVGNSPLDLAVTPDGSAVYVTNNSSANVSVIDTVTNTVSDTITVSALPRGIAITPDGLFVYVGHQDGLMTVIDIATNTVATTFATGGTFGINIVITPDGSTAYVADRSGSVIVIDIATNTVTQTISSPNPRGLALTPPSSQVSGERIANIALGQREFSNIVTWTTPTDITTTGYLIFRDSALTDLAAEISDPNILKFEENNLSDDEAYTYQVVALDQYNNRHLLGSGVFLNFR